MSNSSSSSTKMLGIRVILLDESITIIQAQKQAVGRIVFNEIIKQLNVLESDYFGLEYSDSSTGTSYWLDLDKKLSRQVGFNLNEPVLKFCVKFYTPDPSLLEEEFTRYLFSLQIKHDLINGDLVCNDNTAALLISYLVQAECGDWNEDDYPDPSYLKTFKFVANQDSEMEERIRDNHKKHLGQSPSDADLHLLETARRTEFYGLKFQHVKDESGLLPNLRITSSCIGILVYQNNIKLSHYSWSKIRKMSFKRKKFLIKLYKDNSFGPESSQSQTNESIVEYIFPNRNSCKSYWKKCIEIYSFFKLNINEDKVKSRSKSLLSARGSSFRYTGRTQKEMISFLRDNFMKRSNGAAKRTNVDKGFGRSSSMRSATVSHHQYEDNNSIATGHHSHSNVSTSYSSPGNIQKSTSRNESDPSDEEEEDETLSPTGTLSPVPLSPDHVHPNSSEHHRLPGQLILSQSIKEFPVTNWKVTRQSSCHSHNRQKSTASSTDEEEEEEKVKEFRNESSTSYLGSYDLLDKSSASIDTIPYLLRRRINLESEGGHESIFKCKSYDGRRLSKKSVKRFRSVQNCNFWWSYRDDTVDDKKYETAGGLGACDVDGGAEVDNDIISSEDEREYEATELAPPPFIPPDGDGIVRKMSCEIGGVIFERGGPYLSSSEREEELSEGDPSESKSRDEFDEEDELEEEMAQSEDVVDKDEEGTEDEAVSLEEGLPEDETETVPVDLEDFVLEDEYTVYEAHTCIQRDVKEGEEMEVDIDKVNEGEVTIQDLTENEADDFGKEEESSDKEIETNVTVDEPEDEEPPSPDLPYSSPQIEEIEEEGSDEEVSDEEVSGENVSDEEDQMQSSPSPPPLPLHGHHVTQQGKPDTIVEEPEDEDIIHLSHSPTSFVPSSNFAGLGMILNTPLPLPPLLFRNSQTQLPIIEEEITPPPVVVNRKSSTASLDNLPLPPTPPYYESDSAFECDTPKYPPPPEVGMRKFSFGSIEKRAGLLQRVYSIDEGGGDKDMTATLIGQSRSGSEGDNVDEAEGPRQLEPIDTVFEPITVTLKTRKSTEITVIEELDDDECGELKQAQYPSIEIESPPPNIPQRHSSLDDNSSCNSDPNSSPPEQILFIPNLRPTTLSRISEQTTSETSDSSTEFINQIESNLIHNRFRLIDASDVSSNKVAPLVTLTSELCDSSATLNDLDEIQEEEEASGSSSGVVKSVLNLNVVGGRIVF